MVIAIDGPAGVGKSTIAKALSEKLNFYYLNSGNFYRAATLKALRENVNIENEDACIDCVNSAKFDIIDGNFFLDKENVDDKLHTQQIDLKSSFLSSYPDVRKIINKRIHELTEKMNIIAEGRDMTTVVFPDANYKFYFDAKPEIRAKRRYDQNLHKCDYEKILDEIIKRDINDKNKPVGALKLAEDAIYIDTSYLTIKQVCDKVIEKIKINNKSGEKDV